SRWRLPSRIALLTLRKIEGCPAIRASQGLVLCSRSDDWPAWLVHGMHAAGSRSQAGQSSARLARSLGPARWGNSNGRQGGRHVSDALTQPLPGGVVSRATVPKQ